MANTRKATAEARTVDTSRTVEKARPAEVRLAGGGRFLRRRRWLVWLGSALAIVVLAWVTMIYIDRVGWEFFYKGRDAVATLNTMARALRTRDLASLEELYAPDFQGRLLGL